MWHFWCSILRPSVFAKETMYVIFFGITGGFSLLKNFINRGEFFSLSFI